MKKRIYGLETEYRIVNNSKTTLASDLVRYDSQLNYLIEHHPSMISNFLINGAKMYLDGEVPEYATPECSNILDLIRYDKAGEKIIFELIKCRFQILKSNVGCNYSTSGCHENYLIDANLIVNRNGTTHYSTLANTLAAFLVSRQILCGAGKIFTFSGRNFFSISQRAMYIKRLIGDGTLDDRAIINTRHEPLARKELKCERLHLILGDSNLSEISTFLKLGTTGIMLRIIEDGRYREPPQLVKPAFDLDTVAEDPDCKALLLLENGKKITAINLQEWYLNAALKFFKNNPATSEEKLILKIWSETLDKLRRDPMLCDQEIDWVIKKRIIELYQDRYGCSLEDERLSTLDWLYHHLDPEIGIYQKLVKAGRVKRLVTEKEIEQAKNLPPRDTRAYLRGNLVKFLLPHRWAKNTRNIRIDWGEVILGNNKEIILDPYMTGDKIMNQLIKKVKEYQKEYHRIYTWGLKK